ncbi:MerR family transcriptional regulator [Lachnoclostridium sp. An169]|uniref:MerR family transcriptional regulator n=1 Tax=Lachnoclostridium sp. An169 TaxID=1965569 RepID=UPI000B39AECD|nr:MerR family transcriptional regulator [Lachnoclostridium sp. An169]OUP84665.1 MerR family transcriptional regulator [Lachnoclostridium sp. An169]
MKSISQVARLTGVSVRTLQYYDEIGLLKPSKLTPSGYRLYDDEALQTLQQILFFKELGFQLKEIDEILKDPDFDRIAAFKKQKELFLLKRNRTDRLIHLLERLEKGEPCMSFKEFDLSDYINALEDFKSSQTETVIEHWGSVENFDMFIQKIKDDEEHVAQLAIRQFGSIEKYTEAMKHNLEHFSEIMDDWYAQVPEEMRTEDKFLKLASRRGEDVSSDPVQDLVKEIIANVRGNTPSVLVGNEGSYCRMIIDCYSNDYLRRVFDTKHGEGSCDYIVRAFQYYMDSNSL